MHVCIGQCTALSYAHQESTLIIYFGEEHHKVHQCALYIYRENQIFLGRAEISKHVVEMFWKKMKKRVKFEPK